MSDTVKVVIEIPKKVFEARKTGEISPWVTVPILDAVQNGIPLTEVLDKMSAEIRHMDYHTVDCDVLVDQEEVLYIIEKYKEEGN